MSAPAAVLSPLRYFIHEDFDALRMEIAGSFAGRAAQKAYESWRSALFLTRSARLVVDISHVTEADEQGKAVLRAWRREDARIVAASAVSREIAESVARAASHPSARLPILRRLASFFNRRAAGNPASAETQQAPSAGATKSHVEDIGFPEADQMEYQVR